MLRQGWPPRRRAWRRQSCTLAVSHRLNRLRARATTRALCTANDLFSPAAEPSRTGSKKMGGRAEDGRRGASMEMFGTALVRWSKHRAPPAQRSITVSRSQSDCIFSTAPVAQSTQGHTAFPHRGQRAPSDVGQRRPPEQAPRRPLRVETTMPRVRHRSPPISRCGHQGWRTCFRVTAWRAGRRLLYFCTQLQISEVQSSAQGTWRSGVH